MASRGEKRKGNGKPKGGRKKAMPKRAREPKAPPKGDGREGVIGTADLEQAEREAKSDPTAVFEEDGEDDPPRPAPTDDGPAVIYHDMPMDDPDGAPFRSAED